jgi:hypothetical protein
MRDDDREFQKHWKKLAEGISKEHDRKKVIELTQELIDMLDEYTQRSSHPKRERYKKSA